MLIELLEILRCPQTGKRLILDNPEYSESRIISGELVTEDRKNHYKIKNGIPSFVPNHNYTDNFGMQWNKFRQTQLDSYSGHKISAERFFKATGWIPKDLDGEWVLDVGCGAGRFAEIALEAGANVIAIDYSSAVYACYANLSHHSRLHVVHADIYMMPLARNYFPFVYSLGVLQHTPNVKKAFLALPEFVSENGKLCTDFYWKRLRSIMHSKYLFRPITKRIQQDFLFKSLKFLVPYMLIISQALNRIPLIGKFIKRIIPVADYKGVYPLTSIQIQEWALLDTFDMLSPTYDNPQSESSIKQWFKEAGFKEIEVFHGGHLVGRGIKA
jgi:2-polyprenyl-3-methyl-5-hydroxy-6-metoxy-1,4-benzoquinol methylase